MGAITQTSSDARPITSVAATKRRKCFFAFAFFFARIGWRWMNTSQFSIRSNTHLLNHERPYQVCPYGSPKVRPWGMNQCVWMRKIGPCLSRLEWRFDSTLLPFFQRMPLHCWSINTLRCRSGNGIRYCKTEINRIVPFASSSLTLCISQPTRTANTLKLNNQVRTKTNFAELDKKNPDFNAKVWVSDPGAYPIMGIVVFACGFCTWKLFHAMKTQDVRPWPDARQNLIRPHQN